MPRSTSLHPDHKKKARLALEGKGFLTQGQLAGNLAISLSTVSNFFNCKKVSINTFEKICDALDLTQQDVIRPSQADLEVEEKSFLPRLFDSSFYNRIPWVGRESLIANLSGKLQEQTRLLWITGISGVGKTALAECLAFKSQNSDVSFHRINFDIEGQSQSFTVSAAAVWAELGERELAPQDRNDPKRLSDRLFNQLKAHSYWIQLDAMEQLINSDCSTEFADPCWLAFLQRCLASSQFRSRLIVTAQALPTALARFEDDYPQRWHEMTLRGLSGEGDNSEHLALFTSNGLINNASNQAILRRIGQIYEGHPLVLQVIAREILAEPFRGEVVNYWERYGDEFEQAARALQSQQVNPVLYSRELQIRVRQRVETSLKRLPANALDLLCRSAVYRRPVPETFWLAMINDRDSIKQTEAYRVLGDRALVEREGTIKNHDLIRQHTLIRSVAYDLLKTDPRVWEIAERQAAHLWLTTYEPAFNASNLESLRGYLEAFDHFCEVEDWEKAAETYTGKIKLTQHELHWQLSIWSYYKELIRVSSRISERINSRTKGICLNRLGNAYRNLGDINKSIAYYEQALDFTRKTGDRHWESTVLGNLGIAYKNLGNQKQAISYYKRHLKIAKEDGDRNGESRALSNLGIAYKNLGQYKQAINYHQKSLTIKREMDDRRGEAIALCNLGNTQFMLKQYKEALENSHSALVLAREVGAREGESELLKNIAEVHQELGDYALALSYCQQALELSTELGIPLAAECEVLRQQIERESSS